MAVEYWVESHAPWVQRKNQIKDWVQSGNTAIYDCGTTVYVATSWPENGFPNWEICIGCGGVGAECPEHGG